MDFEKSRREHLEKILKSNSHKKIIVAGPGTGKTYTFGKVLQRDGGRSQMAMTFIRLLVDNMSRELPGNVEVCTFHKFCKALLHKRIGTFALSPGLPKLIEVDAHIFGLDYTGFSDKFQLLKTDPEEIGFYFTRSDYYTAVSFDDCVYRLLEEAKADPTVLPEFDLLVVDEFQDFNALEVALIDLLETKGNVLIVGDDDQSVYDTLRNASPNYLRAKYRSGEYETFELPYCSRCTSAVVGAVKSVIANATSAGLLTNRVTKPFDCYMPSKGVDSGNYPKVVTVRCTTASVVGKYVAATIKQIPTKDIIESNRTGSEYFTALVIGPHRYLREVEKVLGKAFRRISYAARGEESVLIEEGLDLLMNDCRSNLGWRIVLHCVASASEIKDALTKSSTALNLADTVCSGIRLQVEKVLAIINKIKSDEDLNVLEDQLLSDFLGESRERVVDYYAKTDGDEEEEFDEKVPSIGLTTYVGSKGLSAGHVFIIGMNNEELPKDKSHIVDAEVCRFLVGLTRTRKQCHLVANKWLTGPKDKKKNFIREKSRSQFIRWIPSELLYDRGEVRSETILSLYT